MFCRRRWAQELSSAQSLSTKFKVFSLPQKHSLASSRPAIFIWLFIRSNANPPSNFRAPIRLTFQPKLPASDIRAGLALTSNAPKSIAHQLPELTSVVHRTWHAPMQALLLSLSLHSIIKNSLEYIIFNIVIGLLSFIPVARFTTYATNENKASTLGSISAPISHW